MTYFEYRLETCEGYLVHQVALEFGHAFYFSITRKSYFGWGYGLLGGDVCEEVEERQWEHKLIVFRPLKTTIGLT